MTIYADLPFDHAGGDGGLRPVTQVIVVHATDNTASDEDEAHYAESRPDHTSAHFYSDEDSVIQALNTSHIAYGCLYHGNRISIQFEISGRSNQITVASMAEVAPVIAQVAQDEGIPIRKVSPSEIRAGVKGICGHADITYAFPEDNGTHTDPGLNFPWATFLGYIAAAANPVSAAVTPEEDEMFTVPKTVALDASNNWVDQSAAVPVPLFPVGTGSGQWGDAWVKLLANGPAKVRVVYNGGGWNGKTVDLNFATDTLVPLPAGTTALYVGRVQGDVLTAEVNATVRYAPK